MKKLQGIILRDRMAKTATVRTERWVVHPIYKKRRKLNKNYHAQNSIGAKVGDKVEIVETRPLSKTKKWRITKI